MAKDADVKALRKKYTEGGLSWKDAKGLLADEIINYFSDARVRYKEILADKSSIRKTLNENADKARVVAAGVLKRVRAAVGAI